MFRRIFPLLGVAAVGAAVVLTVCHQDGSLHMAWQRHALARPRVEAPVVIDLGAAENGSVVEADFAVVNRGGGEVRLFGYRTGCACEGLEQEIDGQFRPPAEVTLKGDGQARFRLRKSVSGPAGAAIRSDIYIRTTDPDSPEVTIGVVVSRVIGGVFAVPAHVPVGTVSVGQTMTRRFDLFDTADPPRAIERAVSTDPGRVAVKLLSPDPAAVGPDGATPIGRLEVVVDASTPGPVEAEIRLFVPGGKTTPDPIRVTGRVARAVEVLPAALALPRAGGGGPVYTTDCLVRSPVGRAVDLALDYAPPGISVLVHPAGGPVRRVSVAVDPHRAAGGTSVVRLAAHLGDEQHIVELVVQVTLPEVTP